MRRRAFHAYLGLGLGALLAGSADIPVPSKLIKPRRLKRGDVIGLITPGSYITDTALEKAVSNLEALGFRVKLGQNIRARHGFVAGTDEQRLSDLHDMFSDQEVAGIWCARGGYGCSRLLPMLDYKLIRRHAKVLIGYSDITALIQAIHQQTGLVGFHGPVAASDMTDYTAHYFSEVVMEGRAPLVISRPGVSAADETNPSFVIREGQCRGVLAGGNLSLLAALSGTPYALDATHKLLFVEEVGEAPYRIDRMLTQLKQSTDIKAASGLAFGIFSDCEATDPESSLSLRQTLEGQIAGLGIPSDYGHQIGHIADLCTLPVGIMASLDTRSRQITLLESGVV